MDAKTSRYHDVYARWQRDPQGFWGEAAAEIDWIVKPKTVFDRERRRLRPLVSRRRLQHLLQRGRPSRRSRPRRAGRDHLRLAGHQHQADHHLRGAADQDRDPRRHPQAQFRRRERRPRHPLHADGAGGAGRDARLRAHRRDPFGGVRRLCAEGARHPHRRLHAQGHPLGKLRHRGRARHSLQAAARRGDQARQAQALGLHDPATAAGQGRADPRPRSRLAGDLGPRAGLGAQRARAGADEGDRSALHPLHLGHDRHPQGRGARQRRPHGRAEMVDEESLRRRARRGVVGRLRHRLGGRPQLHRLCAAAAWRDDDPLRGQAGRHAGCGRVLARHRRARRGRDVHRADRVPRHQEGRPARQAVCPIRFLEIPHAVPRRRARRSRHHHLGREPAARSRSSITGGRPRPAGASPAIRWAWASFR